MALLTAATEHAAELPGVATERLTALHSDLAAAYLSSAAKGRPWHHADALASALAAVAANPNVPTAAFNLALALERLSLNHQADQAWTRYLALDDDPGWQAEAKARQQRLGDAGGSYGWSEARASIEAGDRSDEQAALDRWAADFPAELRAWFLDRGLSAWLDDFRSASLQAVARAIERRSGDRLYLDIARALDQGSSPTLDAGVRDFLAGAKTARGACSEAIPHWTRAAVTLGRVGNPLAFVAKLEAAICRYRRDPTATAPVLAALAAQLDIQPYQALRSRVAYMRGLCEIADGYPSRAIMHYRQAEAFIAPVGGTEALLISGLLDEAHRLIGDEDEAWQYRMQVLGGATEHGNRRLRHAVLSNLANELADRGRDHVATTVLEEMLANARDWDEAGAIVETLLRRITLAVRTTNSAWARADIAACRAALSAVSEQRHRERFALELALAEGESLLLEEPSRALTVLGPAVEGLEAHGHQLMLPRALLALARAQLATGDGAAAELSFNHALTVFEERYDATQGSEHRIQFFEQAQPAFNDMIRLYAVQRGDAARALRILTRAQARDLSDQLTSSAAAFPMRDPGSRLDVVVVYAVLPEQLILWIADASGWRMRIEPYGRTAVADAVTTLRHAIENEAAVETAAGHAYDLFLRPVADQLRNGKALLVVPDRELHQLPFAALYDRARGRFLVEDHPLTVAPSLALVGRGGALHDPPRGPHSVLAVGDPAFDPTHYGLPRLKAAADEARQITGLYPRGESLLAEAATRAEVLGALAGHDIVHLAAHVQVDPRRPLRSLVVTAGKGPPLRVADIDPEHWKGVELVFLSACDTAPGYSDGNREGIAGFARALLAASVPSVVATLWAADDQAAARLAVTFHRAYRQHGDASRALQAAQLDLITDASMSPPHAWASFQLYGG